MLEAEDAGEAAIADVDVRVDGVVGDWLSAKDADEDDDVAARANCCRSSFRRAARASIFGRISSST